MPSVEVRVDNVPEGKKVTIPGLGSFPNKKSTEVKQAKFDSYVKRSKLKGFGNKIVVANGQVTLQGNTQSSPQSVTVTPPPSEQPIESKEVQ